MTDLAQTPQAAEVPAPGSDYLPSAQTREPADTESSGRARRNIGGVIGWVVAGIAGAGATVWFIFFGPGETGSKSQWFFGAVVFVAVLVSLWQTHSVLRQARHDAAEADERQRRELAAANERSARELALVRSIHEAEMDAQRQLARAELAAQVELARVERAQLLAQQQRLAMNEVSRGVNLQTNALATLWNQSVIVLGMESREAREQAMSPIFEQISQVVRDFSVEWANAQLLVEDDRIHRALDRVNEAVLTAMHVAEDVHVSVVDGKAPQPDAVSAAQRLMRERAAEARHLAWNLLRAGLDDAASFGGV
jgi:hypothetical protein